MSDSTPPTTDAGGAMFVRTTSDTSELAGVRRQVEAFCAANGFDERACGEVGLCVNEAMANVIRHAYRGKPGQPIELTATVADGVLRVAMRDWGEGQPPPGALPTEKADPLEPGGLGLICLGRLLDRVTFTPQPKGMLLELLRRRGPRAADAP